MIEFKFFIDRGGTFTDVLVEEFDGAQKINYVLKLLSEDPETYDSAPREAIRQVLWNKFQRQEFQNPFKSFSASGFDYVIKSIYMGTTVATNMLLERKGSKTVFITTKGFGDLLEIGYQNRPEIFSLDIIKPKQLYDSVLEIDERILADGAISLALDENKVREQLTKIQAETLAISLMHSYINNLLLKELLRNWVLGIFLFQAKDCR